MRKAIQLFIEDEESQLEKEEALLPVVTKNYTKSLKCFQRIVPSVYQLLENYTFQHSSIFANKDGELDIVESSSGSVFYGKDPKKSVAQHVEQFLAAPQSLVLTQPDGSAISSTTPSHEQAIIIFGIGLGQHILALMQSADIKHIIIYEPNLDLLFCSLYTEFWPIIFDLARSQNVSLYFQVPNNGKSLFADLSELHNAFGINSLWVYFHYHSSEFDDIKDELSSNDWRIGRDLRHHINEKTFEDYLPKWPPVVTDTSWSGENLNYE